MLDVAPPTRSYEEHLTNFTEARRQHWLRLEAQRRNLAIASPLYVRLPSGGFTD